MTNSTPAYYTTEEAAEFLRLSPKTLCKWRSTGNGPAFHKIGRKVAYTKPDLVAFVTRHKFVGDEGGPSSEAAYCS